MHTFSGHTCSACSTHISIQVVHVGVVEDKVRVGKLARDGIHLFTRNTQNTQGDRGGQRGAQGDTQGDRGGHRGTHRTHSGTHRGTEGGTGGQRGTQGDTQGDTGGQG